MAGVGLVVYSLGLALFAVAPGYVVGVLALVIIGGCFLAVIATTNTSTQMIVADRFRGRVLAIRLMLFTLAAPIGSLAWGAVSDAAGPRTTVLGSALLMGAVATALLVQRGRFRLQRLDDPHDVAGGD
jgi:predicted MFS family arabinose efflux permease